LGPVSNARIKLNIAGTRSKLASGSSDVYPVLGRRGSFPIEEAVAHFRQSHSIFEGRVKRAAPGVGWPGSNPGRGASTACGMA